MNYLLNLYDTCNIYIYIYMTDLQFKLSFYLVVDIC